VRNAIYTNKEVGSGKWRRGEEQKGRREKERGETIHNWVFKVGLGSILN
jgi:hypothetical protein